MKAEGTFGVRFTEQIGNGDYEGAIQTLRAHIGRAKPDPSSDPFLYTLAILYLKTGRLAEAVTVFTEILDYDRSHNKARIGRAHACYLLGKRTYEHDFDAQYIKRARSDLKAYLAGNGKDKLHVNIQLAQIYLLLDKPSKSLEILDTIESHAVRTDVSGSRPIDDSTYLNSRFDFDFLKAMTNLQLRNKNVARLHFLKYLEFLRETNKLHDPQKYRKAAFSFYNIGTLLYAASLLLPSPSTHYDRKSSSSGSTDPQVRASGFFSKGLRILSRCGSDELQLRSWMNFSKGICEMSLKNFTTACDRFWDSSKWKETRVGSIYNILYCSVNLDDLNGIYNVYNSLKGEDAELSRLREMSGVLLAGYLTKLGINWLDKLSDVTGDGLDIQYKFLFYRGVTKVKFGLDGAKTDLKSSLKKFNDVNERKKRLNRQFLLQIRSWIAHVLEKEKPGSSWITIAKYNEFLYEKGNIRLRTGKPAKAIEKYLELLDLVENDWSRYTDNLLFERRDRTEFLSRVLSNLATSYFYTQAFPESVQYAEKALAAATKCGSPFENQIRCNLALFLIYNKEFERAEKVLEQAGESDRVRELRDKIESVMPRR